MAAVLVQNVSKVFRLYRQPADRIREMIPLLGRPSHTEFWALRDVSLAVERGEILAIVGPNGSGKSTLLQIVSGILKPTAGRVLTRGRVAALLELGAGFNPEFTGRENVFINGEIMGLARDYVERAFPSIEAFAGIGEFMDRPVKEYSSGMYVRLAFATAIHVEPEILIVDEALAVGDAMFANRCVRKFEELRERGVTILFVSHDLGLVKRLAHRAVLMLNGKVETEGSPRDVVNRYVGMVSEREKSERASERGAASFRHGDGASEILCVEVRPQVVATGEPVCVRVTARFHKHASDPIAGIMIRNRLGIDVFGTNTRLEQLELGEVDAGESVEVDFRFECRLASGEYSVTAATQHWDGASQDWLDDVAAFTVADPRGAAGVASLATSVQWRKV
ncbi:MAG TPA: ABC transporter ATP-binding protein [Bryobacteraceae bacterium]|nr:ABC transporter ATP-binding protein [Bryobacteraceae bacterium]